MGRKKRKSTKGSLIKGMTKRVPSDILEHPLIEPALKQIMKGYSGIYVLYRGAEVYYVGLTKDLFGRLSAHLRLSSARCWRITRAPWTSGSPNACARGPRFAPSRTSASAWTRTFRKSCGLACGPWRSTCSNGVGCV